MAIHKYIYRLRTHKTGGSVNISSFPKKKTDEMQLQSCHNTLNNFTYKERRLDNDYTLCFLYFFQFSENRHFLWT